MKGETKEPESDSDLLCDQAMRNHHSYTKTLPKYSIWFLIFFSLAYLYYSVVLISPLKIYNQNPSALSRPSALSPPIQKDDELNQNPRSKTLEKTQLRHIVFGIGASSRLWLRRKNYIKSWWKPKEMRGFVWLDNPVKNNSDDRNTLPTLKISGSTKNFRYTNSKGSRSAIRISRIVSEIVKLGLTDVRWLVMGDDDTFFVAENLVRVLGKYDHNQFYYIGSPSESHVQNIHFSYNMAYGGGGFAISYPLARALAKMQDGCIQRYPGLYGSDDRIQACMAELGVPLTKEVGFHQFDMYGNVWGLLAAHPIAPLVSLHHLDLVDPIFPHTSRVQALQRLKVPMKLDSAGLMQQSICYNKSKRWTVSVSWGYTVQIFRSIIPAREMEKPQRTFLNWYMNSDSNGFTFNTRPISRNPCQRPDLFMLSNAVLNRSNNWTASEYVKFRGVGPQCKQNKADPFEIHRVVVHKRPDPNLWDKARRRNCCRILPSKKTGTLRIDVGDCGEGEIIQ